jgi:ketosteroid isomerase-like protein
MSSSHVDRVRAGTGAFNRGEYDGALDMLAADFTWDTTKAVPDGRTYCGREEIKAYWLDVADRWDSLRIEADEWIDAGDRVVMLGRLVGVGSGSGVPVEGPWNQVWSFEGGALVRCENYVDPDEALSAGGVASQGGRTDVRAARR